MALSTEAIVAIVSIFVGLPPALLVLWSMSRRRGRNLNLTGITSRWLILHLVRLLLNRVLLTTFLS
jgi:hypothetical protein